MGMNSMIVFAALLAVSQAAQVFHSQIGGNFAYSTLGAYPYTLKVVPEVKEIKPIEVKSPAFAYSYLNYPYAFPQLIATKSAEKEEAKPITYSYPAYSYGYPLGYPSLPVVEAPKAVEVKTIDTLPIAGYPILPSVAAAAADAVAEEKPAAEAVDAEVVDA